MRTRRKFTTAFKTKVVLEALSERYSIQELARKHEVHPTQIAKWKAHFLANAHQVFEGESSDEQNQGEAEKEKLYKIIGQQKVEIDFLKRALS